MQYPLFIETFTDIQLAFIIIVPIVILLFIGIGLYFPISHYYKRKNFQIHFYKKVYKTAFDRDYYLINQFVFKVDSNKTAMVDHILFGDKFIYVIISQYYEGDLIGKATDASLVFVSHRGKKSYTDNPINQSKVLTNKLSSSTGLNASLLIGIVLINDDCKVQVQSESKQFYIIQRKRFASLIKAIESRKIGTINEPQLAKAVQSIAKANKRKKQ
ncbi:MAG TPA: NERD domain-containing protein [Erysipelotrichaceae bacterium]|nr:NERD domain-containing protein [Erysipelotrichaceae bacterium]